MRLVVALLAGSALIAASIAYVGRWQISAVSSNGSEVVYRLDRWTGEIVTCRMERGLLDNDQIAEVLTRNGMLPVQCREAPK